jgi:hypothetical protein
MGNWKLEEINGIQDAISQMLSAPRVPGKCQASYTRLDENRIRLECLECEFYTTGPMESAVQEWNDHIVYR